MTIPFFLTLIGSILACSVALAAVTKNMAEGLAVSGKKPFVYGSVSAIVASAIAYLTSYASENPFLVFWFLGGVFLLLGVIHMLFIHKRYFYVYRQSSNKVLLAEILFGLSVILFAIVVFAALQFFVKQDKDFLFYPIVMSTLMFFVPILVFHSFQAAYAIPEARFSTWQYPLGKPIDLPKRTKDEKILVIGFEVAKAATDNRKTYFRVGAPETWKLGDLFYHFINEHNDPDSKATIEYVDKDYEPHEWWFHKKGKWYQVEKILNPEFTVRENGITENTVIICERLLSAAPITKTYNNSYER